MKTKLILQAMGLGKSAAVKAIGLAMLVGLAITAGGCAGGYYQAGYPTAYYAPNYGAYYGDYGYAGDPYVGYGGYYGSTIVVGGAHHGGYYGYHHFVGERGRPSGPRPAMTGFHGAPPAGHPQGQRP